MSFTVDPETTQPASARRLWDTGRVYRREGSPYWWIYYRVNCRSVFESSKSTGRDVAEKLLEERLCERNRNRALRQKKRMARRMFEEFTDITLVDLLAHLVRMLAAELHKLKQSVPCVYFVQSGESIKIGHTNKLDARMPGLQCGNPEEIELLAHLPGPRALEKRLHKVFAKDRSTASGSAPASNSPASLNRRARSTARPNPSNAPYSRGSSNERPR